MRLVMLVLFALTIDVAVAVACPGLPCNKYDRMRLPAPLPVEEIYRAEPARRLPRLTSRAAVTRFLRRTQWVATTAGGALVFVDPTRALAPDDAARVWVRQLERRQGAWWVAVRDQPYRLVRCPLDAHRTTTCLVRTPAPTGPDLAP